MKNKKKKGFTLVELIVVIAIIAILAAVAVPTTMIFVKKANVSAETSNMDVQNLLQGVFTDTSTTPFDMTDTGSTKFEDVLKNKIGVEANAAIGKITFTVASTSAGYTVAYEIRGMQYGKETDNPSKLAGTISGTFTAAQIFAGGTAKAGDYIYTRAKYTSAEGSGTPTVNTFTKIS